MFGSKRGQRAAGVGG